MAEQQSTYAKKRKFEATPEPPSSVPEDAEGDLDPLRAEPGPSFVIHQHYATRLHHDVRLEMHRPGGEPVLVSWAVPKGLPRRRGTRALAVRTEDHPFAYGTFTGSIPSGNYGAGEVRIFDAGTYEIVKRDTEKITFRLQGTRLMGVYHLVKTSQGEGKEQWLALLSSDERPSQAVAPPLEPMLATLIGEVFDDPAWLYEPKWDGVRALAICDDETKLVSRLGNTVTVGYPELSGLHDRLVALDAIIDGEIVALEGAVPSFQKLQRRMHVRDERQLSILARNSPVTFMAFDLIYLDGTNLTAEPLSERRRLLEETVVPNERLQVSPAVFGEGTALFEAAKSQSLEGIVAKKITSIYEPGRRSQAWLKIKTFSDLDAIVVGWTEGSGQRQEKLGSLVLALFDENGELRHIGNVGTGFDQQSLKAAMDRLEKLPTADSPFDIKVFKGADLRKVHWVAPTEVATVEYRQVTAAGKLRAPSFKGFRDDKAASSCTLDQLANPPSA
jgi:bifunctional non-homologous end joining protein LigD